MPLQFPDKQQSMTSMPDIINYQRLGRLPAMGRISNILFSSTAAPLKMRRDSIRKPGMIGDLYLVKPGIKWADGKYGGGSPIVVELAASSQPWDSNAWH
jgi:hypothetical protein